MSQPQPLALTPLSDAELPPQVARVVSAQAPLPMKQMAARGLLPLPPPDLAVALYQLAHSGDEALRQTVLGSLGRLPEPVLRGALSAPQDPRVLDFFARQLCGSPSVLNLLLDNRHLHDRTVEFLATACEPEELDRIAKDEQRLLRAPYIVAALYMNPKTRASTAMRAVELVARSGVRVDIPGFDELVASLEGVTLSRADDEHFEAVVPSRGSAPPAGEEGEVLDAKITQEDIERTQAEEEQRSASETGVEAEKKKRRFEELPVPLQIRAATLGNAFDRSVAIRSTIKTVALSAVRSPAISIQEVVKYAANRALNEDVIRYISNRRDWTQLNAVRLGLISNNKCPLGTSMRLLTFVHNRDLKAISRSKNIPGPLVKAAKELLAKREKRT